MQKSPGRASPGREVVISSPHPASRRRAAHSPQAIASGRLTRRPSPQAPPHTLVTITSRRWYSCSSVPAPPGVRVASPWVSGASTPVHYQYSVTHSSPSYPVSGAGTPRMPDGIVTGVATAQPFLPFTPGALDRPVRVSYLGCSYVKEDLVTASTRSTVADSTIDEDIFVSPSSRTNDLLDGLSCSCPAVEGRVGPSLYAGWRAGLQGEAADSSLDQSPAARSEGAPAGSEAELSPSGSSFVDERKRLHQLSVALKADIDRTDQILQEIEPRLRSELEAQLQEGAGPARPGGAAGELALGPAAAHALWQPSPSLLLGDPCLDGVPSKETLQLAMRRVLEAAVKSFEKAPEPATESPVGRAAAGGALPGGPRSGARTPDAAQRRLQHRRRAARSPEREPGRRSSSQEAPARRQASPPVGGRGPPSPPQRRAVSAASTRAPTPEPPVRRAPQPPSPATQLRAALQDARSTGLGAEDALYAHAEELLREHEKGRDASRAELRDALAASGRAGEPLPEAAQLLQIRERLVRSLASAKRAGLPDDELREAELRRRRVHNAIEDLKGQIRVFCRVRPLSSKEASEGDLEAVQIVDDMTLEVPRGGQFSFDSVFAPGSQEEVFDECKDLIQSAVDGHNVTIFAYGQTGAGKTFTLYGTPEQEGIAPRAIVELFRIVDGLRERCAVSVSGSMVELYNNTLVDLLRPARQGGPGGLAGAPRLSVRQDRAGTVQVERLFEREAADAGQLRALLERGLAQRRVAASAMNIRSSRSHLVFTIRVSSTNPATGEVLSGKILLCDLGGSERLKKTEAAGDQRREAIEINKSLTALGDVIEAVARRQRQVPYRNHKLTQIMQDSLGGTAKTLMFVNCSPAWSNLSETLMSLTYAARTKRITNLGAPSSSSSTSSPLARKRSEATLVGLPEA